VVESFEQMTTKTVSQLYQFHCKCLGAKFSFFQTDVLAKRHTLNGRRVRLVAVCLKCKAESTVHWGGTQGVSQGWGWLQPDSLLTDKRHYV
jgi:hypothetical protein